MVVHMYNHNNTYVIIIIAIVSLYNCKTLIIIYYYAAWVSCRTLLLFEGEVKNFTLSMYKIQIII